MDSPETFTSTTSASAAPCRRSLTASTSPIPNSWDIVKGFSVLRHFQRETDNEYAGRPPQLRAGSRSMPSARVRRHAARLRVHDQRSAPRRRQRGDYQSDAAGTRRDRRGSRTRVRFRRLVSTCPPARRPRSSRRHRCVPATPSASTATASTSRATGASRTSTRPGNQFGVEEFDNSYFVQMNWNVDVFDRQFFGNVGVRYAMTRVESPGFTTDVAATGPRPIKARERLHRRCCRRSTSPIRSRRTSTSARGGQGDGAPAARATSRRPSAHVTTPTACPARSARSSWAIRRSSVPRRPTTT